jgi:hypothetical protein
VNLAPALRPRSRVGSWYAAPVVAVIVAGLAMQLGWHGVDWPAQLYRVHLFRTNGWVGYDTGWYGGNVPLAYSTLYPPLAAALGVQLVAIGSVAVSAWAFDRLVRAGFGSAARVGSVCFAAGLVVQVVIGQLSFLLGLALGLTALLALRNRRTRVGAVLAIACSLASFVAGLFLFLGTVAAWCTARPEDRRTAAVLTAAAAAPILLIAVAYHQAGRFPFPLSTLGALLVACAGLLVALPASRRTLRLAVWLYAASAVALFIVPTPVGANVARAATVAAAPLLLCVARRRAVVAVFVTFLVVWQLAPALRTVTVDPAASTTRAFYVPLLAELARVAPAPSRLEIPLTLEHWEAAWVAPTIPLARGWERQLDIVDNPLFYRDGPLTPSAYRAWLAKNGIGWVALPRAPLDYSARAEAHLLRAGPSYLQPTWSDRDWTLWRVVGTHGMVTGPARLTALDAASFTVVARRAGAAVVRIRYSPTWSIVDADGASCLGSTSDSWTRLRFRHAGPIRVEAQLLPRAASAC